ncbi:MAG: 4Fe-4S ferredoxin [Ruminococcaceae bacterium]|nr:4Fe-4S ferredoxin [Oscillospiraceae bacterium]
MLRIAKDNLTALFREIAKSQSLFLPVKNAGQTNYGIWTEDKEADLDTLKTVKSAKDIFFPQSETLYTCFKDGKKIEIKPQELEKEKFVVFGMRACDIEGIKVLDKVFLSDPVDSFYKARRDHATIVALSCSEPEESCFCSAFGIDCAEPIADVRITLVGDSYIWEALSQKGEELTQSLKTVLIDDADEKALKEEKEKIRNIVEMLPLSDLSLDGFSGDSVSEKFDSPIWEELYKPCLACGTCTFVCPTCQCYDIKDYTTNKGVERYRCWDSCMYSDFTMMAHGNNRTSQMQRYRQRFMHKLCYFPANNDGMYSCVGCGRCVEKCPQGLNIVKVIKAFNKQGGEK